MSVARTSRHHGEEGGVGARTHRGENAENPVSEQDHKSKEDQATESKMTLYVQLNSKHIAALGAGIVALIWALSRM
jgi:hypothetical protein